MSKLYLKKYAPYAGIKKLTADNRIVFEKLYNIGIPRTPVEDVNLNPEFVGDNRPEFISEASSNHGKEEMVINEVYKPFVQLLKFLPEYGSISGDFEVFHLPDRPTYLFSEDGSYLSIENIDDRIYIKGEIYGVSIKHIFPESWN